MPAKTSYCLAIVLALAACAPRPPERQTLVGGQAVDLDKLTPAEIAGTVQVILRGNEVVFQAPPIQANKIIDLSQAGKELGLDLGKVERIRVGYLFGVLDRPSGAIRHFLLFQSNFVAGANRYVSVSLADGTQLPFTVARVPDPCIPNCFPIIDALIAEIADVTLRAQQASGLPLTIALDNGHFIRTVGGPPYVAGYLMAIDDYRTRESAAGR